MFLSVGRYARLLAAQEIPNLSHSICEFGFAGASGDTAFPVPNTEVSMTRLHRERFAFELSGEFRWGKSAGEVLTNDVQGTIKFD